MITPDYARTMARYNRWMNGKLYDCAGQLDDASRKADMGAFFKSIHGTLNHLLLADRVWMGRFIGPVFVPSSLADELHADFGELRHEREMTDAAIEAYAATLDEARLRETLRYTSISRPAPQEKAMGLALAHFFNHQSHHRGQVTTLLMQRGVDPGVTDLIAMP
jgi:uncharacterized damage-inducible protein DinB